MDRSPTATTTTPPPASPSLQAPKAPTEKLVPLRHVADEVQWWQDQAIALRRELAAAKGEAAAAKARADTLVLELEDTKQRAR